MKHNRPLGLNERRNLLTGILLLAFLLSLFAMDNDKGLMHSGGWATLTRLFSSLLSPDFSADLLKLALQSTWLTFAYALITLSLSMLGGFFLSIFASGVLFRSLFLQGTARAILGFLRVYRTTKTKKQKEIGNWLNFSGFGGRNPLKTGASARKPLCFI